MDKRTIKLKGNELGWILKLANEYLLSEQFQTYLKRHDIPQLQSFLHQVMGQFHETNFYAGTSEDIWILTNDSSKQTIKLNQKGLNEEEST